MRLGKTGVLMIILALVLSGCGVTEGDLRVTALRDPYADLTSFSAQAEVLADYGERVYQYSVTAEGTLNQGRLTVTEPEALAGASFSWENGEGVVSLGDVTLETGTLSPDGLSPVDGMYVLLDALARGSEQGSGQERLDGEETLCCTLSNPAWPDDDSTVTVWLGLEDGALRRGEISWEGTTVITYCFTEFTYETEQEEG